MVLLRTRELASLEVVFSFVLLEVVVFSLSTAFSVVVFVVLVDVPVLSSWVVVLPVSSSARDVERSRSIHSAYVPVSVNSSDCSASYILL